MSKNFNTNTKNDPTWLTPPYIIEALGHFDLDPCSPPNMPWRTADVMNSLPSDGLELDWRGKRVWLNPPYGRETFKWLKKLSESKRGIALIFSRTETNGFHEEVWSKAHSIFFFRGRLRFHYVDGSLGNTANAPSCLISYSNEDTISIRKAIDENKLNGKLVLLSGNKCE